MISRRRFLKYTGATAAVGLTPGLGLSQSGTFLEMTARASTASFLGDGAPLVPVWSFNGTVPGPTIRATRGDTVRVRLHNELEQPTSIHWHGIRIDNAMDGVAGLTQDPVAPGETFDYEFSLPDAGTFWYHSHNRGWEQVERGLYGALIVDEPVPPFDPRHDVTLVLDDWLVSSDGRIDEGLGSRGEWSHGGRLGNWPTVNGLTQPEIPIPQHQTTRVRLINAANARIFELDLAGIGAEVIAYDGQTLARPVAPRYNPVLLGPAQRMDIILTPEAAGLLPLNEMSGGGPFPFARFAVDDRSSRPLAFERALEPNALKEPDLAGARVLELHMEGGAMGRMRGAVVDGTYLEGPELFETKQFWAFNGIAGLAKEPFFRAKKGESISVRVINDTAFPHAMHVHGHHFRVTDRGGATIDDNHWRDTFLVGSNQTTTIAFVADNPGKWLFHCHMLEHQAAGMTTWFEVS